MSKPRRKPKPASVTKVTPLVTRHQTIRVIVVGLAALVAICIQPERTPEIATVVLALGVRRSTG